MRELRMALLDIVRELRKIRLELEKINKNL